MIKTVEVTFPGGKKVDAKIGETVVRTDQPKAKGGDDSAPNPFILFLSSIATCTGFFALDFCQSRDIETKDMQLTMDCDFNQETKHYDKITLTLKLPSDFPEKYKSAIIRAMDLCAVKRHLKEPPEFVIKTN